MSEYDESTIMISLTRCVTGHQRSGAHARPRHPRLGAAKKMMQAGPLHINMFLHLLGLLYQC